MPAPSFSSRRTADLAGRADVADLRRVTIASVKEDLPFKVGFVAQYNPAQLQIEENASWAPSPSKTSSVPQLEFTGSGSRTLSLELFFDGYEQRLNVQTAFVEPLSRLVRVMDPDGDHEHKRPPVVRFAWGEAMPNFLGVITSLSTKLTMFLADGTPVRATCAVKILEVTMELFERRATNRVAAPRRG